MTNRPGRLRLLMAFHQTFCRYRDARGAIHHRGERIMRRIKRAVLGGLAAAMLIGVAAPAGAEEFQFQCTASQCLVTQCWEFWCFWGG